MNKLAFTIALLLLSMGAYAQQSAFTGPFAPVIIEEDTFSYRPYTEYQYRDLHFYLEEDRDAGATLHYWWENGLENDEYPIFLVFYTLEEAINWLFDEVISRD